MILEMSLAIASPAYWGFYWGFRNVDCKGHSDVDASTLLIKFWFLMINFTVYTSNEEE